MLGVLHLLLVSASQQNYREVKAKLRLYRSSQGLERLSVKSNTILRKITEKLEDTRKGITNFIS